MTFGKNRVQYQEFLWTFYKFDDFDTYFYLNGKELAEYTGQYAKGQIPLMGDKIESGLDSRIQFVIFNKLTDLKQSNIGLVAEQDYNTGGITHIIGSRIMLYFDGNHLNFQKQIRAGIAEVIFNQMMFGGSMGKQVKTSTFFSMPDWYKVGLISYLSDDWSVEFDNRVRDGILSGRYKKVNSLEGDDAVFAGHSLWRYIANKYGKSAVSNIIHMTSSSNSIDKGFRYVIGLPFKVLVKEWQDFYLKEYELFAEKENLPQNLLPLKYKDQQVLGRPTISPFGKYLAYTSNEMGKFKIWIYDLETGKKHKVLKKGVMIDTKTDYSYPLLAWHPTGKLLSIIIEEKGLPRLYLYDIEEKKFTKQTFYQVQKITDFSYSNDGRFMVMTAVQKGQSDLFVFNIAASSFEKLTNDLSSELNPCFINNSSQIVFSSNRKNDTIGRQTNDFNSFNSQFDLFIYDYKNHNQVLKRITQTPAADELQAESFGYNKLTYLSDENGIVNNYLATIDSTVISVDTAINYRYFINNKAVTNLSRNIIYKNTAPSAKKDAFLVFHDNLWKIYVNSTTSYDKMEKLTLSTTNFMAGEKKKFQALIKTSQKPKTNSTEQKDSTIQIIAKPVLKKFYMVYTDKNGNEILGRISGRGNIKTSPDGQGSGALNIINTTQEDEFVIPKRRNYYVSYFVNELVTQIDFNYVNYSYQPFTGGHSPIYLNPDFNVFLKTGLSDLMEDHRFAGGVRFNFSFVNNEYIGSYANLKHRLDKEIVFHRNTLESFNGYSLLRIHTHEIFYKVKWPFSEALSIRGTAQYRNDMFVWMATDQINLEIPNKYSNWIGLKAELVFDNTRSLGKNLLLGTRYKLFAEYNHMFAEVKDNQFVEPERKYNLFVIGFDLRHYTRIHRTFIWANRFAASTSFGASPLIYYMGGVDNWLNPKFSTDTPIDYSQNYAYQTLATNMRGFYQNTRNGNSFAVINSELRFPLFQYFSKTPISSSFLRNFQLVAFGDIGTAWTGLNPYSEENALFTKYISSGPFNISVIRQKEPVVGGVGLGARIQLAGYFIRGDVSWGIEDYRINIPVYYLSFSLDF
jgi:Tol biopolymer transport system component